VFEYVLLETATAVGCNFEFGDTKSVDYLSPASVLAGTNYKIFVYVICRYVEVTVNSLCVGRKTLKKGTSYKT
jgi:hypothetical protein